MEPTKNQPAPSVGLPKAEPPKIMENPMSRNPLANFVAENEKLANEAESKKQSTEQALSYMIKTLKEENAKDPQEGVTNGIAHLEAAYRKLGYTKQV